MPERPDPRPEPGDPAGRGGRDEERVGIVGQHVRPDRDPALYTYAMDPKQASLNRSALAAYKLSWQTVLYAGYSDEREFAPATDEFEKSRRVGFIKISYAWQR